MALTTPFDYTAYLVGEEIIYRALTQQKNFAGQGQYGMTWTPADVTDRDEYETKYGNARQHFVNVPQHCVPYPPCPWDKVYDKVAYAQFKDVIMLADAVFTYRFRVHLRTDQGTTRFTPGAQVIGYQPDQDALDAAIRNQFRYFKKEANSGTTGKAVIVIERMIGGTVDKTYYYLFDLE